MNQPDDWVIGVLVAITILYMLAHIIWAMAR